MPVAILCGMQGLKDVTDHHLLVTSGKEHRLMHSTLVPKIKTRKARKYKDKIVADVSLTPAQRKKAHLRKPTQAEIRHCFYALFSIAIMGIWRDHSKLKPSQIRSLMHKSGLKTKNSSVVVSGFKAMISDLKASKPSAQSSYQMQGMCTFFPIILSKVEPSKRLDLLGFIEKLTMIRHCPVITTKQDYVRQIKQAPFLSDNMIKGLHRVPDDHFIVVNPDYKYHAVHAQDIIRLAKIFIYYLS